MKKLIFILFAFLISVPCFSQESNVESQQFVINLSTFAGVVTFVSFLTTQIFKSFSFVKENKIVKILISSATGVAVCMIAYFLNLSVLLEGLEWWEAVLYGVCAGLSGCGFYDIIRAIGTLFKKDDVIHLD